MERFHLSQSSTLQKGFENGITISINKEVIRRPIPGSTAKHEAAHIVAAGKIRRATIIPSGNALGSTEPVKMTAGSAAAAGAMGYDGYGWDKFLTEHYLGVDWNSAKAQGRAMLKGTDELQYEVATVLEEDKTIGQDGVEKAEENLRRRRNGIHAVEVNITSQEGKTKTFQTESFREQVSIRREWVLPQTA